LLLNYFINTKSRFYQHAPVYQAGVISIITYGYTYLRVYECLQDSFLVAIVLAITYYLTKTTVDWCFCEGSITMATDVEEGLNVPGFTGMI